MDAPYHSRCDTLKSSHCSMAMIALVKITALHRYWWRLHMSEKFSSGSKNPKQTDKQVMFDSLYDQNIPELVQNNRLTNKSIWFFNEINRVCFYVLCKNRLLCLLCILIFNIKSSFCLHTGSSSSWKLLGVASVHLCSCSQGWTRRVYNRYMRWDNVH